MNAPPVAAQFHLVLGAADMRKAINGLSILIADSFELNMLGDACFVFCNSSSTRIDEEVSEKLDVVPPQMRVVRHIQPTCACRMPQARPTGGCCCRNMQQIISWRCQVDA